MFLKTTFKLLFVLLLFLYNIFSDSLRIMGIFFSGWLANWTLLLLLLLPQFYGYCYEVADTQTTLKMMEEDNGGKEVCCSVYDADDDNDDFADGIEFNIIKEGFQRKQQMLKNMALLHDGMEWWPTIMPKMLADFVSFFQKAIVEMKSRFEDDNYVPASGDDYNFKTLFVMILRFFYHLKNKLVTSFLVAWLKILLKQIWFLSWNFIYLNTFMKKCGGGVGVGVNQSSGQN